MEGVGYQTGSQSGCGLSPWIGYYERVDGWWKRQGVGQGGKGWVEAGCIGWLGAVECSGWWMALMSGGL